MAEHGNDLKAIPSKPINVEQIVKSAQSYDYNPLIPLKYWLRTASTLLKEVWAGTTSTNLTSVNDNLVGRDLRA